MSEGAADLIRRMLVVDVEQRLTIQAIMQHPWFRKDLPKAALKLNDECLSIPAHRTQSQAEVDEILVQAEFPGSGSGPSRSSRAILGASPPAAKKSWSLLWA
ncbi:hypothetical protein WJX84_000588 [Apatococcus fuscideae]|uniref:Uncharacterized protein n=1 Tax=Apatococcus fuscideae TaxID=2026836 RepID=A0AAW1T345_9CHLO